MSPDDTHFDKIAAKYDEHFPAHITAHYLRKRVRLIGLFLAGGLGLDVGCGTGTLMAVLASRGRVLGVDASAGMLDVLRKAGRGEAARSMVEKLPFADDRFDVVFSVAVFHHVADPARVGEAVREMVRVCRPGGHVVIWDHNPRNPFWRRVMRRAPQDTGEERLVPAAEFEGTLRACGIGRITTFQSGFMPPFMPRWLIGLARIFEIAFEHTPLLRRFAVHNVLIARK